MLPRSYYSCLFVCIQTGSNQSLLLKSPKLFDAHRLIDPHCYLWNRLGLALRVSYNYRTELKNESISDSERLEGVLYKWIETESVPVTWDRLIEALEEIELKSVVRSIQEFLTTNNADEPQ